MNEEQSPLGGQSTTMTAVACRTGANRSSAFLTVIGGTAIDLLDISADGILVLDGSGTVAATQCHCPGDSLAMSMTAPSAVP